MNTVLLAALTAWDWKTVCSYGSSVIVDAPW